MASIKLILRETLGKPVRLPAGLWRHFTESDSSAPYLVSCLGKPTILYVSPRFKDLTGYACQKFIAEGITFWFSVIHPADMQAVVGTIAKAQHELMTVNPRPVAPMKLEYRITRKDGRIIWIREFKQIVSYQSGKKDHVLGCFHDVTAEKAAEQAGIKMLLKTDKAANGLLDVAITYQLQDEPERPEKKMELSGRISPREKQVLQLVAAGYSTKQIAAELTISENTVETHRRHLLKKFKVNNSTALVKEAHRRCLV